MDFIFGNRRKLLESSRHHMKLVPNICLIYANQFESEGLRPNDCCYVTGTSFHGNCKKFREFRSNVRNQFLVEPYSIQSRFESGMNRNHFVSESFENNQ